MLKTVYMRAISIVFILILAGLFAFQPSTSSDQIPYNIKLLHMCHVDTVDKNDVLAFFLVTPIKKRDFPPVLSMRVSYQVNGFGQYVSENLMKQNEDSPVNLAIYGDDVAERDPYLYSLIEDKFQLENHKSLMILAFRFNNISDVPIETFSMKYGLWEKRNLENRLEQTYTRDLD